MNKAVFLDRDGVLNRERDDYTWEKKDFEILPDVIPALKQLQKKGYLLIVITNQGGIGRNLFTFKDVETVHQYMKDALAKEKIKLSEIYYCFHHPVSGNCLCRKPGSLLVEKAMARFNINPAKSWFVGDNLRDTEAGEKVGVRGILIEKNTSLLKAIKQIK